jgi:hypothetical protein
MSIFCGCCSNRRSLSTPIVDIDPSSLHGPSGSGRSSRMQSMVSNSELFQPSVRIRSSALPLGQLVLEDSDGDDENESEVADGSSLKKQGGAFDTVRTKVIRHLSQDSGSKRHSLASIGNSEEEIARRAELKRIMHKRIQDELKSEECHDGSSDLSTPSALYLAPLIDLPGGGPRDTLEFSVVSTTFPGSDRYDFRSPTPNNSANAVERSSKSSNPNTSGGSSSCSMIVLKGTGTHRSTHGQPLRESASLPRLSCRKDVSPSRRPSAYDASSIKSWGVSYNSSYLARVLGNATEFLSGSESQDGNSTLGNWLIAQGMGLRHSSSIQIGDAKSQKSEKSNDNQEKHDSYLKSHKGVNDIYSEQPRDVHLHEMNIHAALFPRIQEQLHTATCNNKGSDCHSRRGSSVTYTSRVSTQKSGSSNLYEGSRALEPVADGVANSNSNTLDASSSKYPSAVGSFQPSLCDSNLNGDDEADSAGKTLHGLQLSPFKCERFMAFLALNLNIC